MQHTLIAVFDNHSDAQKAMTELLGAGFTQTQVRLDEGNTIPLDSTDSGRMPSTDDSGTGTGTGMGASIKHFFSDLFGDDSDSGNANKYTTAIERGNHALTVSATTDTEVEQAADIIERFGPIDIDEKSAEWAGASHSQMPVVGSDLPYAGGSLQGGSAQGAGMQGAGMQSAGLQDPALQSGSVQGAGLQGGDLQSGDLQGGGLQGAGLQDAGLQGGGLQGAGLQGTSLQDAGVQGGGIQGTGLQGGSLQGADLQGGAMAGSQQRDLGSDAAIPVVQEQLKVGKREVQRGGVRIYSRVVETPVQENVTLREEHVHVERRPVDQMLDPDTTAAFQEQTIEMREQGEEAVVQKTARVVEEVVVSKDVAQRQESINDTVRHTEVEVEQLGQQAANDDTAYRSHWNSNYASSGQSYDEYAPAYSYGSEMANQYSGRQWNDVESDLHTSWDQRHGGGASTWERFKGAVRHGWDSMTR